MEIEAASLSNTPLTKESSAQRQVTSDFETFLSLLTAQLENQDPLQPLDSTEFVAQLAQFSSVEQQVATNEALDEVLATLRGDEVASLGQWIGREVETRAALKFTGDPITLSTSPEADATAATLIVTDLEGRIVGTQAIDPGAAIVSWNGLGLDGRIAPDGFYRFVVERSNGDAPLPDDLPRGYARVTEIQLNDGAPSLVLESGDVRSPQDVSALRDPN